MKQPLLRFAFALCSLMSLTARSENWPGWRGPTGTGTAPGGALPLKWSATENVRWHTELPGPGNSSPIVWGKLVFVTQAVEKDHRRTVMCFDRVSGKSLWQSGVTYEDPESTQQSNPYCAGTPATDGKLVYACFGSAGVYAYDLEGKEAWHRDLGKISHMFGNAVSPVLYEDLCILYFGPDAKSRLVALNKRTGETVWEVEPPKVDESERQQGMPGGRGGFGPGMFIAPQIMSQADKNGDQKLTPDEFKSLADAWFDKLDPEKTGKVSQDQLTDGMNLILPPPQDSEPRQLGGRGGFGPGRFIAPGIFSAADADKDGSMTRDELKSTFAKWYADWDSGKTGLLDQDKVRDGLNAALPRPQFGGGPGGPGGPGGQGGPGGPGGRGPGGPGGPGGGRGMGDPSGSWSTPLLIKADGHDQLVVNFPNRLAAYEPKTGKQIWLSKGLGGTIYTTPLWGDGTLIASSSGMGGGNALALKPGGSGDVTETQRRWRLDRVKSAIGSGVIHDGHLYTMSQDGVAECFELATGNRVWEERLKGSGSRNGSWSSMLLAGDRIYVPNQAGDVFVLRASPKFELLATNSVAEPTNASLAASNGDLFLRTDRGLWCFAGK